MNLNKLESFFFNFSFSENKAYELNVGSQKIQVYCVLSDTNMGPCGGGGWTLVMKINGTKVIN